MTDIVERLRRIDLAATNEAADEIERLRAALQNISCPSQISDLLWWQQEARAALSVDAQPDADTGDDGN